VRGGKTHSKKSERKKREKSEKKTVERQRNQQHCTVSPRLFLYIGVPHKFCSSAADCHQSPLVIFIILTITAPRLSRLAQGTIP
jgi:hypothetical protein